jgi:hypothetical protein
MKKLPLFLFILLSTACSKDGDPGGVPCGTQQTNRIGAKCMDGTTSTATGSGACSSHGGVDYWLCSPP